MSVVFRNNLYSNNSFEPLHHLFLRVSKYLNECATERLRDESFSRGSLSGVGKITFFASMRRKILFFLNSFLLSVQYESMDYRTRVHFSKTADSGGLDGLFRERDLAGMLEGKDYVTIDMVLPFLVL